MALRQKLMNFRCGTSSVLQDQSVWKTIAERVGALLGDGSVTQTDSEFSNGRVSFVINAQQQSHATLRSNVADGKCTLHVDIVYPPQAELEKGLDALAEELGQTLSCTQFNRSRFPVIRHGDGGASDGAYMPTVDKRWIEYDYSELVFEQDSAFQNVKIYKSGQYGNCLVLDGDMNLAESDLAYTQAIIGEGVESYKGKRVLILGGGDGGILNQLLKYEPAYVEMVEIDQVVIDGAIKHLRGICGSAMDSLEGSNYKVRVEDCIPALKQHIESGNHFDFVINDLTAIPISTSPNGDFWDFMRLILDLSFQALKPDGVYYTQGNSFCAKSALAMYEGELAKLSHNVQFSTNTVCVPSYNELWVFYEVWRKDQSASRAANRLKPLAS
eukprot:scpid39573/ scgid10753/ Spermine synthase; Spermidine aminopropyltransferase